MLAIMNKNNYEQYLKKLSRSISTLRDQHNLTLDQLSRRTGLSATALSKAERGEQSPNIKTLYCIAQAYDVNVSYLLYACEDSGFKYDK